MNNVKNIILQELADFEKMPDEPKLDYKSKIYILFYIKLIKTICYIACKHYIICLALERDGFDENPLFFCNVATFNEKVIGYALFFYTYSTWCGKTMCMDDLYVTSEFRGKHVGIKLLRSVAKVCFC